MKIRAFTALAMGALLGLTGCTAKPALQDPAVYAQSGMEISRTASEMADTLYSTMFENLAQQKAAELKIPRAYVKNVTMPRVAVTSFVDTDTYEAAGHLGRVLGEIFIHELNLRQINVLEYKLTGNLAVGKTGEYVYSRDYKKLAQTANISHLLTGTISRNEDGVVLVARVVNMNDHMVLGTATGFIPYKLLPYCYRTYEKGCSLNDIKEYAGPVSVDSTSSSAGSASAAVRSASAGTAAAAGSNPADSNPATSQGNYPQFLQDQQEQSRSLFGGQEDSVIYPAHSYMDRSRLVRDVHDESQYQRLKER